ncbi:hypothetical protein [Acinetobacter lanii]|uniref:hypothetical protein n=1 Tax=Acinetobacter lanii TaxID=2715163 RepID=UPI0029FEF873|nr:hypothetical protein [Acinetobacter lanii]
MSNPTPAQQLAQALMLEQVAFIKQQLLNTHHNQYLKNFIQHLYSQADQIQLKDVILLEQLQQVVQKYAFDLNLGPELLEFIGVVAQKVHQYAVNSTVSIHNLCSDQVFEDWIYKIFELEQVRYYLKDNLQHNPKAQLVSLQLANQILESNTPWLDHLRKLTSKQHGIGAKLVSFVQDQQQNIELKLEQQLAQALLKQLGQIITLSNAELTEISLELWSDIKNKTLAEVSSQIQALDLEDFFVLVYETWRTLRQIPFMQNLIQSVVEAFYDYFGAYSLQSLLLAVGIEENDLYEEADRFVPHVLKALDQRQLLDGILTTLIQPFYSALNTEKLIESFLQNRK